MRILIRMALIVLIAHGCSAAIATSPSAGDFASLGSGLARDSVIPTWAPGLLVAAPALLLCWAGAFGLGFWRLVGGGAGAWLLALYAGLGTTWARVVPWPPSIALVLFFAAIVVGVCLFTAWRPGFRSGPLRVRDGGDHLSVADGDSAPVLLRHGRLQCLKSPAGRTETRVGGGPYLAPTTGTVTTYGPNGVSVGTVHGTQIVSGPTYTYEKWVSTGKWRYRIEELGIDHALLQAPRPANVEVAARHAASYRGNAAGFELGGWAAFRFDAWRLFHARAFYRPDRRMRRRIARAASRHFAAMKRLYGRTRARHLLLDHALELRSFVGVGKDQLFVHVPRLGAAMTIARQDAGDYLRHDGLHLPGGDGPVAIGTGVRNRISEWAQLRALRGRA